MTADRSSETPTAVLRRSFEGARRHLENLYEISALLTNFESVNETLADVIAIIADAVATRTAVFVDDREGAPQTLAWHAADEDPARVDAALAQARAQFAYLAGYKEPQRRALEATEAPTSVIAERRARPSRLPDPMPTRRIVLPLAVQQDRVFGALQVETEGNVDEVDIAFLNAAVIQLAIALDRHSQLQREKRLRERAEILERAEKVLLDRERLAHAEAELAARRLEFLVEASGRITASLDRPTTLAGIARLALPVLADWAMVDAVGLGGSIHRVAVTDGARASVRLEDVRTPVRATSRGPDRALQSRLPEIVNEVTESFVAALARRDDHRLLVQRFGLNACLIVPVLLGTEVLGAITFVRAEPGRSYDQHDLMVAVELCRRGALAIENARLYESAKSAVRTRDDFLAIVSHDLRNPLTAIVLNAKLLAKPPEGETAEARTARAQRVHRIAQDMDRLIADLLDATTLQSGRFPVLTRALDATAFVDEAVEMMRPMAGQRSLTVVRDPTGAPLSVAGDRGRLLQIFSNLIGNAIKFTQENGKITVGVEGLEHEAVFTVCDDGPGIPPEHVKHVFERYWQAKRSRAGVGLGLSITKMIVEAHGGRIWAESVVGKGATFRFTLPRADSAKVALPPSSPRS